jgi:hypothetical protein
MIDEEVMNTVKTDFDIRAGKWMTKPGERDI